MLNFNLEPNEYPLLDLSDLDQDDLDSLAYFLWGLYRHDSELMGWRERVLLPMTTMFVSEASLDEEEEDSDD